MSLTDYRTAKQLQQELGNKTCQIIEFNRITYSHFAFYIGDGICVHVQAPHGSSAGSLSPSPSSKGESSKKGTKRAERLSDIAGNDPCRVNNLKHVAISLGLRRRSPSEALELAVRNLPRTENGEVKLGESVEINYFFLSNNNCEGWATYWMYETNGISAQALNGVIHSTFGTVERFTDRVAFTLDQVRQSDNANPALKVAAETTARVYQGVGSACKVVRQGSDMVLGLFGRQNGLL